MLNEHYHAYVIHTSHQDGWQQKNRNQEFACIILSKLSFILKIFFFLKVKAYNFDLGILLPVASHTLLFLGGSILYMHEEMFQGDSYSHVLLNYFFDQHYLVFLLGNI